MPSRLLLLILLLPCTAAQAQETIMVPVKLDGMTVRLEMRIYKPAKTGRVPTLVFNHGSTGRGRDSRLFLRPIDSPELAQFFVQRGWAVVMPARRGRAHSEGEYNEGFEVDRSKGYSCTPMLSIPGADRALTDIAAAMESILAMPFVDPERVVIGGQSRGGILSVAYAGQHPEQVKAVINFVGGWMGTGCMNAERINQEIFKRGARFPGDTLWLYGEDDPFYPLSHSRKNFEAFQKAGGKGTFNSFPEAKSIGHRLLFYPDVWGPVVEDYLNRLALPTRAYDE